MTQEKIVLQHMKMYHSITSMEAFENYGITRLSAKIFDLRKDGYNIVTQDTDGVNRYGRKVRYATYILVA